MPEMDGWGFAEQVRSRPHLAGLRLLLASSVNHFGVSAQARALGFEACFTKPVPPSALRAAVHLSAPHAVTNAPRPSLDGTPAALPSGSGRLNAHVLLAEDNPVNQRLAQRQLLRLGCSVRTVSHGREALDALQRETFDLVLMDCQMPVMDGYEATRILRAREVRGERLTVIALTAHAMDGAREGCLQAGMDDHLTKPVSLARVIHQLSDRTAQPAAFGRLSSPGGTLRPRASSLTCSRSTVDPAAAKHHQAPSYWWDQLRHCWNQ